MADYDEPPHDPHVTPEFGPEAWTPNSTCKKGHKYPKGSQRCCMDCHKSGVDHFKALRRSSRTDPKPEKKSRADRKHDRVDRRDPKKNPHLAKRAAEELRASVLADRVESARRIREAELKEAKAKAKALKAAS